MSTCFSFPFLLFPPRWNLSLLFFACKAKTEKFARNFAPANRKTRKTCLASRPKIPSFYARKKIFHSPDTGKTRYARNIIAGCNLFFPLSHGNFFLIRNLSSASLEGIFFPFLQPWIWWRTHSLRFPSHTREKKEKKNEGEFCGQAPILTPSSLSLSMYIVVLPHDEKHTYTIYVRTCEVAH